MSRVKKDGVKIREAKAGILDAYSKEPLPWVVAYSGGKDSTLTLQLVLETISKKPGKEVTVLYADTKVEPPPVIKNARRLLKKINVWAAKKELPVKAKVVYPALKDRFFFLMLGKGYLPPTHWFRWCTKRLKVRPIARFIERLVREGGGCIVLLGTRKKESSSRDRALKRRGFSKWMPFEGVEGASIYAPIFDLTVEDVWEYLLNNEPPWGLDNQLLRTLYTGGNNSCSLFCGGIRFGCWVCTVVRKDRCTEGLSEIPGWEWLSEFLDYRELMLEVRNDPKNRLVRFRNGKEYVGPLTIEARGLLLSELKKLERRIKKKILTPAEESRIRECWVDEN